MRTRGPLLAVAAAVAFGAALALLVLEARAVLGGQATDVAAAGGALAVALGLALLAWSAAPGRWRIARVAAVAAVLAALVALAIAASGHVLRR